MVRQNFSGARDTAQIISTEVARHEFIPSRFIPFWLNGRRPIPRSADSGLDVPGIKSKPRITFVITSLFNETYLIYV